MSHRSKEDEKHGLNDAQLRCLDFYRSDPELNQTRAYQRAYPNSKSEKATQNNASRLICSDRAQAYLKSRANAEQLDDDGVVITVSRIIQELKRAALFNPKMLVDGDTNRLKELHELPDHVARAIASFKTTKRVERGGKDEPDVEYYTTEVKLVSKEKSLELLGKHLVMFTEKFQIESEEVMYARVRAEIIAQGEETLAMILANTKRQLAIDQAGPVPDDRPESPKPAPDLSDPAYIASLL
ncbi:MAG: terminase small subunit [Candidatus Marinimicrobia bacterium]|nr:terminase small subunit [Candidatus Neomarinimicrobiota bacterium]